jgi:hypothetical protein
MTKKVARKLVLDSQVIRALSTQALQHVVGGKVPPTAPYACADTCTEGGNGECA